MTTSRPAPWCFASASAITTWLTGQVTPDPDLAACFLRTPFDLPDGTLLRLAVEPASDGRCVLTDFGAIYEVFGAEAFGRAFPQAAEIAESRGVSLSGEVLEVECETNEVPVAFWRLTQACLQISGLYRHGQLGAMAEPRLAVRVAKLVNDLELPLEPDYELSGQVDMHTFEFGRQHDDDFMLVQVLQAATPVRALQQKKMCCWDITDVRSVHERVRSALVVDDSDARHRQSLDRSNVLGPLRRLHDAVIPWSTVASGGGESIRRLVLGE